MSNRRVHARLREVEVVRYDRAGKWYVEYGPLPYPRVRVGVQGAARTAVQLVRQGGRVYLDMPGGRTFDRIVTQLVNA